MHKVQVTPSDIQKAIRNIPDFPQPGIQFKDITPVLADRKLFAGSIELLTENFKPGSIDAAVGIDARGFIFAGAEILEITFLIELGSLQGRQRLGGWPVRSIVTF